MRYPILLLAATAFALATPAAHAADFPVHAQLTGGSPTYRPGEAPRSLTVHLGNTTSTARRDVHAVIVLVDRERTLTPRNVSLQYRDAASRTWRAVPLTHTGNDENVGVVGGEDGPGMTLAPQQSAAVELRLRFGRGTRPGHVAASATVMQRDRAGADGEWVGQSEPYEFDIVAPGPGPAPGPAPGPSPGRGTGPEPGPEPGPGPGPGPGPAPETTRPPQAPAEAPQLAATGTAEPAALAAAGLLIGGAALVIAARRHD
jgi:LPXTG-motif cell wall-anchored protein